MNRVEVLFKEVSLLKAEERLALVERILETVRPTNPDIDKAWLEEAERRWAAYKSGEMETYDADEVLAELRVRSRRGK